MRCVDVNVLVYAHRADLRENARYRDILEDLANDEEPLGVPDAVTAGFLRVVTSRRISTRPTSPAEAWAAVDRLLDAPPARLLVAGERHWHHFRRVATRIEARGQDLPDAFLAAYATWLSADRGFARFPGLRRRHPLD